MELLNNKHIKAITQILEDVGERIEGNLICDITPHNWTIDINIHKIRNLQYLSRGKRKIMEIGVNACHSLLLMIMENPDAEYLLFDLNYHRYTEPTLNYIKAAFPTTKITAIFGDSVQTISKYIEEHPEESGTYDLIHLDGGHTEDIFTHDYINSKSLSNPSGVVVFDDYNYIEINTFINRKINQREIVEYTDPNITRTPFHFVYRHVL